MGIIHALLSETVYESEVFIARRGWIEYSNVVLS